MYTVDFLLDELHKALFKGKRKVVSIVFKEDGSFTVDADDIYDGPRLFSQNSDTLLKALLKLTLALHDAGVKL